MQKNRVARVGLVVAGLIVSTAGGPQPVQAATGPRCYVDIDATGSNTGNSWKNAYTDLQSALTDPNCTKIWVAEGLYKPTTNPAHRSTYFQIPAGVEVYGGFAGTETDKAQRDPGVNVTVLSGDIDDNDVTDADGVVTAWANVTGSNSYHVVEMRGLGTPILADTVLDGFILTAGQANSGSGPPLGVGGGIYCDGWGGAPNECSPTLSNLTFSGNIANLGGGLYNDGYSGGHASPTLTNSLFRGNWAASGGAIFNDGQGYEDTGGNSSPSITNVTFEGNSANAGGAIYNLATDGGASNLNLASVTFHGNSATTSGGAIYHNGGGSLTLRNVILWGDVAPSSGHEIYSIPIAPDIDYSVLQSGNSGLNWSTAFSDGTGNTSDDPTLLALDDYGGFTQTIGLMWDSSALDAADDSGCPVEDQRGVKRPKGTHCDIGAFELEYKTMKSQAAKDGWVLESSETSGEGGSKDSTSTSFKLGDNASKKQYKAILSFDTSVLPDAAEILSVELGIKKSGESGPGPFGLFGNISVDMKAGKFGSESSLQKSDFEATPGVGPAMILTNTPVDDWYANMMDNLAFIEIKKTGLTQFRLGFVGDDNGDEFADYLKFYSGDAGDSKRPQLIISYYVP